MNRRGDKIAERFIMGFMATLVGFVLWAAITHGLILP